MGCRMKPIVVTYEGICDGRSGGDDNGRLGSGACKPTTYRKDSPKSFPCNQYPRSLSRAIRRFLSICSRDFAVTMTVGFAATCFLGFARFCGVAWVILRIEIMLGPRPAYANVASNISD